MTVPERFCPRCGETYPELFFRRNVDRYTGLQRRRLCIGCEQTGRDTEKVPNRFRQKVIDATRSHARKFGLTPAVLRDQFGWEPDRMARDAEESYAGKCDFVDTCGRPYTGMGHGTQDIQLDVIDPTAEPFYGMNTRWICGTCNRRKGATPPHLWRPISIQYRRWQKRQDELAADPYAGGLFGKKRVRAG